MSDAADAPTTLEGWFVLHRMYRLSWPRLRALPPGERAALADQAARWLQDAGSGGNGDSAVYGLVGHKGDLMFLHYREDVAALKQVELSLTACAWSDLLEPTASYLSVIEVSLYEAMAAAAKRVADRGLAPSSVGWQSAYDDEMTLQRQRLQGRLRPVIPTTAHLSFYPMSKRRGEQVNWYSLPLDERRALMRGHGRIGHKYTQQVTQVVSGSIGLDDWEWGVDLHSDDPLAIKRLITEMRFDPASALYAEFGTFWFGLRAQPADLAAVIRGGGTAARG